MAVAVQQQVSAKQLAQVRPASNAAVSAIKKAPNQALSISSVLIVNTTSGSANYSLYLDNKGTTYDATTALYYSTPLAANTTVLLNLGDGLPMPRTRANTGNFAVQSNTANALTFTINGFEF